MNEYLNIFVSKNYKGGNLLTKLNFDVSSLQLEVWAWRAPGLLVYR